MLETPTDENVVRWGNDGDSFVVLEVRRRAESRLWPTESADGNAEREIHKTHLTQALQAQQLRQLRQAAE